MVTVVPQVCAAHPVRGSTKSKTSTGAELQVSGKLRGAQLVPPSMVRKITVACEPFFVLRPAAKPRLLSKNCTEVIETESREKGWGEKLAQLSPVLAA